MNRVGHAFFKGRMREVNAVFGGEVTGHYYFRDFYYCDNGFIPALLILELMSRKNQTLAQLLDAAAPEVLHLRRDQHARRRHVAVQGQDRRPRGQVRRRQRLHDGRRLGRVPDWHFNVRASNTEPLIRLNLEATTKAEMERKRDEVLGYIRS